MGDQNQRPRYNNNNNNKRGNNNNNYFSQSIQRDGENFIEMKHPQSLQYDCIKIFRELAAGKIDINQYAQYLSHPTLLHAMVSISLQNMNKYCIVFTCIENTVNLMNQNNQQIQTDIVQTLEEYRCKKDVYSIIFNNLQNFGSTGDVNFMIALASQISRYRRYI